MNLQVEGITYSIVSLSEAQQQLKVTGEGKVIGWSIEQPWFDEPIVEIYLEEGITEIGKAAFANMLQLKKVWLPSTLKKIRDGAFSGCPELVEVYYTGELSKMQKIKIAPDAMPPWFYPKRKERR